MRATIFLVWLVPFLGAAAFGQDDLPAPRKDLTAPAPLPALPAPRPDGDFSGSNPGELQKLLEELRAQRDALKSERALPPGREPSADREAERRRLRARYEDALKRFEERRPAAPGPVEVAPPPASPPVAGGPPRRAEPPTPGPTGPIDPLAMAQNLYKAGDIANALLAFRRADELLTQRAEEALRIRGDAPRPEDRMPVKYMIATCLRQLGKTSEAETLYREIANSKGDEFVAECARWQVASLSWKREMESGLAQLRQRTKAARDARLAILGEK